LILIELIGGKRKEALPPDVRKGSAFPISLLSITFHRGEAKPRHGEKRKKAAGPESRRLSAHQAAKPQTKLNL
jgi:hypothetical protein